MKKYVLIFRMDISTPEAQPSVEQMQIYMRQWKEWISEISSTQQLADGGNHLSYTHARVLYADKRQEDCPYTVNNQSVAGYIIVLAKNLDDATSIAANCPILQGKATSVEVRETTSQ